MKGARKCGWRAGLFVTASWQVFHLFAYSLFPVEFHSGVFTLWVDADNLNFLPKNTSSF